MRPKKAIILVAGKGKRLRPLTHKIPKCLVKIKGKSILINTLENLEKNNIKEAILVVGFLKEKIKKVAGEKLGKMKIRYIENNLYDKTENTYTLALALKDLDEDLLILEGDIFFEEKLLCQFLKDKRKNLTIVEKYRPGLDGTFAQIGKGNKVISWVHKKDRPPNFTLEDKYKTVNIHKFSASFIKKWIKPILKKYYQKPIESVFSEIVKRGAKIFAFKVRGLKWVEIDETEDLKRAKEIFEKN